MVNLSRTLKSLAVEHSMAVVVRKSNTGISISVSVNQINTLSS